jgi:hypothetical protein
LCWDISNNLSFQFQHFNSFNITKIILHAYDVLYAVLLACLKQNKNYSKVDDVSSSSTKDGQKLCSLLELTEQELKVVFHTKVQIHSL